MSLHSPILSPEINQYIVSHSVKEHPVLQKIRAENLEHAEAFMQITPEQAQFLTMLVKISNAKKVIELGVFLGYSAIALALGLPDDGKLLACEINEDYANMAKKYLEEAGLSKKAEIIPGPASATLKKLIAEGHSNEFDFIFIDADKLNYSEYFELSLQLVRKGGIISIDNVLWYGRILDESDTSDMTRAIKSLNEKLYKDDRIELNIIPIGDGMTIAIKK